MNHIFRSQRPPWPVAPLPCLTNPEHCRHSHGAMVSDTSSGSWSVALRLSSL